MTLAGAGFERQRLIFGVNAAEQTFATRVQEGADGRISAYADMPDGDQSPAWLGPLADVITARAALAATPKPSRCVTVDLRLDSLLASSGPVGRAVGRGRVVRLDRGAALAEGTIHDSTGQLIARCVGRLRLAPVRDEHIGLFEGDADNAPASQPLRDELGMEIDSRTPARATLRMVPGPTISNQLNAIHGGVQLSIFVIAAEIYADDESGRWRLLDVTVSYLSPGPIDVDALLVELTVDGRTGNFVRVSMRLVDPAGAHPVATATACLTRVVDLDPYPGH